MATTLTPEERTLRARLAAYHKHAAHDPVAGTEKARQTFAASFEAQVPAEITDPAERARRAEALRKAHYTRMALRSAQSRRAKAARGGGAG